ncbi:MAG: hypothetical protein WC314_21950, partial [Vulcanimicrobiota bacterium]
MKVGIEKGGYQHAAATAQVQTPQQPQALQLDLGPVDIQPSVTKLVHFPPPEAKFSSNRSTIPQKIPLQEEK